jgi:membrane-associated protein
MFESVLTRVGEAVGAWLYVIAGALAFAEAAILLGMVLPGETALLVAGVFCQRGVLNLGVMIIVAVVCAILGDSVGFEFGRAFGPTLRRSRLGHRVGENRWSRADAFLRRHGGKAIFLGRLTAILRALVPSLAGMSGMHYGTFLMWNAAGGILWGAGCVLLGYAFSSALATVGQYLTWGPLVIVGVIAVVLIGRHLYKRRRDRAAASAAPDAVASKRSAVS